MAHTLLFRITEFGDQAVILPVVAGVALLLLFQGRRGAGAAWLLGAASVLGTVLAAKLLFLGCGWRLGPPGLPGFWPHSPSGHTAATAMVLGNLTVLVLRTGAGRGLVVRRAGLALAVALLGAGMMGLSRVALWAHTVPDVVAGAAIGCAGVAAFALRLLPWLEPGPGPAPHPGRSLGLAIVVAGAAVLVSGWHLGAEAAIIRVANDMARSYIPVCYRA